MGDIDYSKHYKINWRGKELSYSTRDEPYSKEDRRNICVVHGLKNSTDYEPIPKKLQKKCRAFLKGAKIDGLDRIIFDKYKS